MFQFPLEAFLKYRRQQEETEMYELSNRIREMRQIQDDLKTIKARAANLTLALQERTTATVTAPVIALYSNYLHNLRKLGLATADEINRAQTKVKRQREKLIKASVGRKIIERLKEGQLQAYIDEEARKEHKIFDEITTLKAGRK
ncbi:MAG: flagellar export protein FliJ [Deltaproteobacteria bacterium]|nr:flagellar export protein FliJ [Deltaproteobacteria bacterium]